jgi:hypothetical protein
MTRVPLAFRRRQGGAAHDGASPVTANGDSEGIEGTDAAAHAGAAVTTDKAHTQAVVTFTDASFADADWTATKIGDDTPGQAASFTARQEATGGNPGSFRRITHTLRLGSIDVWHSRRGFVYNPAVQGAIENVGYSYDLSAPEFTAMAFRLLLHQGNGYYAGPLDATSDASWRGFGRQEMTAAQFDLFLGTGPAHPDFSTSGTPIEFGFLSANTNTVNANATILGGIDNYSVTITPLDTPPAPTLEIAGPASAHPGYSIDYRVILKDAAGQPVNFVSVLMTVTGGPVLIRGDSTIRRRNSATATTHEGVALFRLFFLDGGVQYTLTACRDQNNNGACDPGELSGSLRVALGNRTITLEGPTQITVDQNATYQVRLSGGPIANERVQLLFQRAGSPGGLVDESTSDTAGRAELVFRPSDLGNYTLIPRWVGEDPGSLLEPWVLAGAPLEVLSVVGDDETPDPDEGCEACCALVAALARHVFADLAPGGAGKELQLEHPFTGTWASVRPRGQSRAD